VRPRVTGASLGHGALPGHGEVPPAAPSSLQLWTDCGSRARIVGQGVGAARVLVFPGCPGQDRGPAGASWASGAPACLRLGGPAAASVRRRCPALLTEHFGELGPGQGGRCGGSPGPA